MQLRMRCCSGAVKARNALSSKRAVTRLAQARTPDQKPLMAGSIRAVFAAVRSAGAKD